MKTPTKLLLVCLVAAILWIATLCRVEGFQMRPATAADTYIETRPTIQSAVVYGPLEVLTRQAGLRALTTSAAGQLNRTYQVRSIADKTGKVVWSQVQNASTGVFEDAPPLVTNTISYTYPRVYQIPNAAGGTDVSSETVIVRYGTLTPGADKPDYYKFTMNYPFVKDVMERNMRTGAYGRELQRIRTPLKAGSLFYVGETFPADTSKPPPEVAQQTIAEDKAGQPMPIGPAEEEDKPVPFDASPVDPSLGSNTLPAPPEYVFPTDVSPQQTGPGETGIDFSQYVLGGAPTNTDTIIVKAIYKELTDPGALKALTLATKGKAFVKEIRTDTGRPVWPEDPPVGLLKDVLQTYHIVYSKPLDVNTTVKPYIKDFVPSVREFISAGVSSTAGYTDTILVKGAYKDLTTAATLKLLAAATGGTATVRNITTPVGNVVWPGAPPIDLKKDEVQTYYIQFTKSLEISTAFKDTIKKTVPAVREFISGGRVTSGPYALTLANLFPTIEGMQPLGLMQGLEMRKNMQFHAPQ